MVLPSPRSKRYSLISPFPKTCLPGPWPSLLGHGLGTYLLLGQGTLCLLKVGYFFWDTALFTTYLQGRDNARMRAGRHDSTRPNRRETLNRDNINKHYEHNRYSSQLDELSFDSLDGRTMDREVALHSPFEFRALPPTTTPPLVPFSHVTMAVRLMIERFPGVVK